MSADGSRSIRGKPVKRLGGAGGFSFTSAILADAGVATVCREAVCPNRGECWSERTATFLLMGDRCTRGCRFCSVEATGIPLPPDSGEPERVAGAAAAMGLEYVVLTSVTRDDLPDGGASVFAATVKAVKEKLPGCAVETLTPDYLGENLAMALSGGQEVFAHNVETVERLSPSVRHPSFSYRKSLAALAEAKALRPGVVTKSSILIGLGESREEVAETMADLRACGVSLLALGQYFRPAEGKLAAVAMLPGEVFDDYAGLARALGFSFVASGPMVRTSYRAHRGWLEAAR